MISKISRYTYFVLQHPYLFCLSLPCFHLSMLHKSMESMHRCSPGKTLSICNLLSEIWFLKHKQVFLVLDGEYEMNVLQYKFHWSRQITMKIDKILELSADESAGWKLQYFIYFHCDLSSPAMSTDSSQVLLFNIFFLSFYLSRFSFYINTI